MRVDCITIKNICCLETAQNMIFLRGLECDLNNVELPINGGGEEGTNLGGQMSST